LQGRRFGTSFVSRCTSRVVKRVTIRSPLGYIKSRSQCFASLHVACRPQIGKWWFLENYMLHVNPSSLDFWIFVHITHTEQVVTGSDGSGSGQFIWSSSQEFVGYFVGHRRCFAWSIVPRNLRRTCSRQRMSVSSFSTPHNSNLSQNFDLKPGDNSMLSEFPVCLTMRVVYLHRCTESSTVSTNSLSGPVLPDLIFHVWPPTIHGMLKVPPTSCCCRRSLFKWH
jgi:hypothetical protein